MTEHIEFGSFWCNVWMKERHLKNVMHVFTNWIHVYHQLFQFWLYKIVFIKLYPSHCWLLSDKNICVRLIRWTGLDDTCNFTMILRKEKCHSDNDIREFLGENNQFVFYQTDNDIKSSLIFWKEKSVNIYSHW